MSSMIADWYDRNAPGENDHYSQPGKLFRKVMTEEQRIETVSNIVGAMRGISGLKRADIINRQLCHFFRADIELGMRVAQGLGITGLESMMSGMQGHQTTVSVQ